jgi:hypothetical protein
MREVVYLRTLGKQAQVSREKGLLVTASRSPINWGMTRVYA